MINSTFLALFGHKVGNVGKSENRLFGSKRLTSARSHSAVQPDVQRTNQARTFAASATFQARRHARYRGPETQRAHADIESGRTIDRVRREARGSLRNLQEGHTVTTTNPAVDADLRAYVATPGERCAPPGQPNGWAVIAIRRREPSGCGCRWAGAGGVHGAHVGRSCRQTRSL